jgi:hypothetical protein
MGNGAKRRTPNHVYVEGGVTGSVISFLPFFFPLSKHLCTFQVSGDGLCIVFTAVKAKIPRKVQQGHGKWMLCLQVTVLPPPKVNCRLHQASLCSRVRRHVVLVTWPVI